MRGVRGVKICLASIEGFLFVTKEGDLSVLVVPVSSSYTVYVARE